MNAKKIMGAVLVALLAAALFVGAGAADDKGTYFVYQESEALKALNGTWTNGAASVVIEVNNTNNSVIMPVGDFVAGTYSKGKDTIYVTYPTASYKLSATYDGVPYLVANGGKVYNNSIITLTVTPLAEVTSPSEVLTTFDDKTPVREAISSLWTGHTIDETGTYKVQAIFVTGNFISGVPADVLLDANAFSFEVVDADKATISASVDTVYAGNGVTITAEGTPGEGYAVNAVNFTIADDQYLPVTRTLGTDNYTFTMPNTGKATFVATVNDTATKEVVMKLIYDGVFVNKAEVKIKISAPVVTATLGAPAYFIGDVIEVTGTSTAAADFKFNITGTNVDEFEITNNDFEKGKEWTANLTIEKKLDVGTYTIKVYQGSKIVATLPVALKQPFISIAEAPEVIGQGDEATFLITAEAATSVKGYIFGTNYFKPVNSEPEYDEDDEIIANLFNITLGEEDTKKSVMATGQYFAVFQHPMYDKAFNIAGEETGAFYLNTSGNALQTIANETFLFNASSRQTANAAQALCDALDSQNIDDMYVKYSFFVVEDLEKDTFSMSEIPTTVVQGETITISGVDTASKEGTLVTVEMVSTAFAAVPKETVGSAAFILVTTTIAEDGTWEVTLDTSDLNVDEYSLSVAIDSVPKEAVTVNVVEADEPVNPEQPEQPEQPENPEEPVAPATPGFGALAALAGLGAVAVLLLRRE